jgi:multidrug efflux system membrane fusion protein
LEKNKTMKQTGLLILVVLSFSGCQKEEAYEKPAPPVRVQVVENDSGEEGPRYSGSIEPIIRADMAFRQGGYVEEILTVTGEGGQRRLVQEGDSVAKGTTLVRLRQSDYLAKLNQAKSQLAQAQSALEQTEYGVKTAQVGRDKAKLDFDRASALFKTQSLTKSDYDGARAQLDAAQATLDGGQSQLELARGRIAGAKALVDEAEIAVRDSTLHAPIKGVVIKRLVELNSLVGPGTPGFILADLDTVKTVFGAPDVLLPHLRIGLALTVSTQAIPGAKFNGRIARIAPAADPRSRVFEVEVTFANPNHRLKPGMIMSIQLPGTRRSDPVPVVPLTAIVQSKKDPKGYGVFVVDDQGGKVISRARDVKLGGTLSNRIVVREGLRAGERIIVTGAALVHDGDPVRIVP